MKKRFELYGLFPSDALRWSDAEYRFNMLVLTGQIEKNHSDAFEREAIRKYKESGKYDRMKAKGLI